MKGLKSSEKQERIMKSVNIIFYIKFNFCQNFKNYHGMKLNKTYLNMFSITLKDSFLVPKFLFLA